MNHEAQPALARPASADPAVIERELNGLWMAEAQARKSANGDEKALTRALLLNLIIFAPDQVSADRAREVVAALVRRQPMRAILLQADAGGPEAEVEAEVSLTCATALSGDEVFGEQVILKAGGPATPDLPGAVLPLLLTDVPTFCWWQSGNPFEHPIFEPLEPGLDRLILDSLSFAPPELYFQEVARVLSDPYFSPRVSDVSWARLASWRYLTAQTFDPPPVRAYLAQIERAQITYAEGSPVLAWLFGGWLASRLEWKLAAQDLRQALRFEGGPLIEFSPAPVGEAAPGDFLGVKLVARDGATFEVAQAPHACAAARVNLQDRKTERLVSFRSGSLADWLGHELSRLNRSPAYEAAVRLVAGA